MVLSMIINKGRLRKPAFLFEARDAGALQHSHRR